MSKKTLYVAGLLTLLLFCTHAVAFSQNTRILWHFRGETLLDGAVAYFPDSLLRFPTGVLVSFYSRLDEGETLYGAPSFSLDGRFWGIVDAEHPAQTIFQGDGLSFSIVNDYLDSTIYYNRGVRNATALKPIGSLTPYRTCNESYPFTAPQIQLVSFKDYSQVPYVWFTCASGANWQTQVVYYFMFCPAYRPRPDCQPFTGEPYSQHTFTIPMSLHVLALTLNELGQAYVVASNAENSVGYLLIYNDAGDLIQQTTIESFNNFTPLSQIAVFGLDSFAIAGTYNVNNVAQEVLLHLSLNGEVLTLITSEMLNILPNRNGAALYDIPAQNRASHTIGYNFISLLRVSRNGLWDVWSMYLE